MRKLLLTFACLLVVGTAMAQVDTTTGQPDDSFMPHGGTHGWDSSKGTNNYYSSQVTKDGQSESDAAYHHDNDGKSLPNATYTKGYTQKRLQKAQKYYVQGKYSKALPAFEDARRAILSRDANADVSTIDTSIASCKEYLNR